MRSTSNKTTDTTNKLGPQSFDFNVIKELINTSLAVSRGVLHLNSQY